jgi:hypothetical protein
MRKRFRIRRPSPALIVAIIALVAATAGTSYAIGLGALSNGAKNKTVGVGKLRYVTTTATSDASLAFPLSASCPAGLEAIGGGIKATNAGASQIDDSYPTTNGWAGHVVGNGQAYTTIAICAKSRVVTGAPPNN